MKTPKTVVTTWDLATYDVWGNANDGYDVNDVYRQGEITLRLKLNTYNAGKPGEFIGAHPTEYQIKQVFGVACQIDVDGDDTNVYVNRRRDSYPLGQLTCTSHDSLSPVLKDKKASE